MIPQSRPQIKKSDAITKVQNYRSEIAKAMNRYVAAGRLTQADADKYVASIPQLVLPPVFILAIRGYYKDSMGEKDKNDRGIYDDAVILFGTNYYKSFNGNTDPRKHEKGKAMLLPGVHWFKLGFHGYNKPGGHPAFRTDNIREVLPVLRDGEIGIKEGVTINLHRGGFNNTNSAGCQTIPPSGNQWTEFYNDAKALMKAEGQNSIPYILLENLD